MLLRHKGIALPLVDDFGDFLNLRSVIRLIRGYQILGHLIQVVNVAFVLMHLRMERLKKSSLIKIKYEDILQ